jgi:hypothetical protein
LAPVSAPRRTRLARRCRYPLALVTWSVAILASTQMPDSLPAIPLVLAVHLLACTAAVGVVFAVDWHGLLWLCGRRRLDEVERLAAGLSYPIWAGVAVLAVTGVLLKPALDEPLVWVKLTAVLLLVFNGITVSDWRHVLGDLGPARPSDLPVAVRTRIFGSALLSQACWLTAFLVGFVTHERLG